ncbi:DNA polymerase IV [Allopusillimonas soli]|uniref:DNA polymerase IV n=1 Tax=Allopusillimonas soli TaxID=659016 RepID=A0A853FCN4_9BURK|nr:DNA polymerase IV [Allopusillimonas soli]NYT37843.1 DNA polymerase IV [Allopusillimonas soli]TEA74072.1 DNA polymerase IV [Allopusillimonas soli]
MEPPSAAAPACAAPSRRVAHLDMDAFYASVELLRYPELRGLPVVIGAGTRYQPHVNADGSRSFHRLRTYAGRGVVTTSTYEARALGVFSAMGMMKAAQLAPDAVLLPVDFAAYRDCSRRFKQAVAAIAPHIEDRGIDEIYIDLTALPEDSLTLARRLKEAVKQATGLSCSIGISPNKLLSKLASELDKPDGITIIGPGDLQRRIWPLDVSKVNGIGPKATERLRALGIDTIARLAQTPPALLQAQFGLSYARWLLDVTQGVDDRPVRTWSVPKSISRETTFERDLDVRRDRAELSTILVRLCTQLEGDLERKGYLGRTVGVKLRFDDFRTVTRDLTLPDAVADAAALLRGARACLKRIAFDHRLRLLGVRISALEKRNDSTRAGTQLSLY